MWYGLTTIGYRKPKIRTRVRDLGSFLPGSTQRLISSKTTNLQEMWAHDITRNEANKLRDCSLLSCQDEGTTMVLSLVYKCRNRT
jgi:hypothetical protein